MKSFKEIADITKVPIKEVHDAMNAAERYQRFEGQDDHGYPVTEDRWFVAMGVNGTYGHQGDRLSRCDGEGKTREEAVIDALMNRKGD
jgi:hypothetical protein